MTELRPIVMAKLADKSRPVLILTRQLVIPRLNNVTVAPITSTIRGLSTEVQVGPSNGLENVCVVSCDNVQTIKKELLGRSLGFLLATQEAALAMALISAYDLEAPA